jgi:hypothetical protein
VFKAEFVNQLCPTKKGIPSNLGFGRQNREAEVQTEFDESLDIPLLGKASVLERAAENFGWNARYLAICQLVLVVPPDAP